jgi:acyl-CoA synthetase (AMP-forming)/AMP-acid ligase II
MKGYLNRPEATAEVMRDGWFRTGDLARRDEDGFYYIVDRAKDMIIRGGFNVYPREVEEVILTHPAISLVAVVGCRREPRRGDQGVRHQAGRHHRGRADRLVPGEHGRVQVPADRAVRRRPADDRHRQDPQARTCS